jgi:DNA invertase Pin-like site-specific DNA recombinase
MRTAYSYRRISSPEQLKGSGLSRQVESAIAYCRENNLRLDDTVKLSDEGISAYRGDNVIRGKLGRFLELVDKSKIKRGSVLIIENLDRLSRQNVLDAQELFLSIVNRGITIVTLMDKQTYSREEIKKNPAMLLLSLSYMIRANEESETKSIRVSKARQIRRNLATNGEQFKVFTPPWCDWTNGQFAVDPHKASIIQRVFKMYLDGKGAQAIAATLNRERVPFIGRGTAHDYKRKSREWYKKYVVYLLKDKRLVGYAHWIDKADYFPSAVSKDLFNRVQFRLSQRIRKGGQTGKGIVNIFAGVMRCGHCGGNVCKTRCINRAGYEYFYLVCENARTGMSCKYRSILLEAVEQSFLYLMRYRPWFQEMMKNDATGNETENRIEILKGEQLEAEKQITKIRSLILAEDNPPKTLVGTLRDFETKTENIKARLVVEEGRRVEKSALKPDENFFEILPEKMKDPDFRLKVREVIRSMVKEIKLFAHGENPHYQIERTNGNFWSVVFLNTSRKHRAFQIFRGKASKPNAGELVFDTYALRGEGIILPHKSAP